MPIRAGERLRKADTDGAAMTAPRTLAEQLAAAADRPVRTWRRRRF